MITAKQRSDVLRAEYMMDMQVYKGHPQFFVFIDETGADRRDCMRRFGYSLRGKPARAQKLLWHGQHVSAIAVISMSGLLDCCTTLSTVTGPKFEEFVQQSLAPVIMPFDGVNPNSVVVLDNASIHHVDEVVQAIQATGAIIHFLPPYSPDLKDSMSFSRKARGESNTSLASCHVRTINSLFFFGLMMRTK